MDKIIRKAVRCYLIKDNEVLAIKYKEGQPKAGYYDIPGGKIEEGETPEQAAIREMIEETSITVQDLKYKGLMTIEYPNRKFILDVFYTDTFEGDVNDAEENLAEWISIQELLIKDKKLSSINLLNEEYIDGLINDNKSFKININVDENENILNISYEEKTSGKQFER